MFPVLMRLAMFMAVLSVIYIALDWYLRWDLARRLEAEHASGEGKSLTREDYVAKGLAAYDRSWGRKLLLGIFVLPLLIALGLGLLADAL